MKITRLAWQNFKGLDDGEILANGNDVIIRGQNGAGKSSIAEVLPFILSGKVNGSIRRYGDDGIAYPDDGLIHAAEVSFDDGTTLRREMVWTGSGNTGKRFINGQTTSDADFKAAVQKLTHGGGCFVFNPFAFTELNADKQRAYLMQTFAPDSLTLSNDDFKATDGKSLDNFISDKTSELKRALKNVEPLPARIDELRLQLADAPTDLTEQISTLTAKIGRVCFERDNLQISKQTPLSDYGKATALLETLRAKRDAAQTRYDTFAKKREELLDKFYELKAAQPGACPTCGQKIPLETFQQKRDAELAEIKADGQAAKKQCLATQNEVAQLDHQIAKQEQLVADLKVNADDFEKADATRLQNLKQINEQLDQLKAKRAVLNNFVNIQTRIDTLAAQARQLYQLIETLKGQIQWAKDLRQQQLEDASERINSHFLNVDFKIFELTQSTGELKITCEPMLHGVPFKSLSKGEKLKAALDIFKAFQDFYDVELPVLLDDAESYTRNSFVELPNQLFLFKVSDDSELLIDIQKGNRS